MRAVVLLVVGAGLAMSLAGCETGDASCESVQSACEIFCSQQFECKLVTSVAADCVSSCAAEQTFQNNANMLHDCIAEGGCSFFDNMDACFQRKGAEITRNCSGSDLEVCDGEGCCRMQSCQQTCTDLKANFVGCGYVESKKHDSCLCTSAK
jgi:hypothetical protein